MEIVNRGGQTQPLISSLKPILDMIPAEEAWLNPVALQMVLLKCAHSSSVFISQRNIGFKVA